MIKKMMTEAYEAPMVEVLDIAVEQGFASSIDGGNIGPNNEEDFCFGLDARCSIGPDELLERGGRRSRDGGRGF